MLKQNAVIRIDACVCFSNYSHKLNLSANGLVREESLGLTRMIFSEFGKTGNEYLMFTSAIRSLIGVVIHDCLLACSRLNGFESSWIIRRTVLAP